MTDIQERGNYHTKYLIKRIAQLESTFILSRVWGSVTNNNGFWIGRLDLLTASFTITHNHNHLQELKINLLPRSHSVPVRISFYDWLFSLLYFLVRHCIHILLILLLPQQFSYNFWTASSNSLIPQLQTVSRYISLGSEPMKSTCHVLSRMRVYWFTT
jgi:hypothetical protein